MNRPKDNDILKAAILCLALSAILSAVVGVGFVRHNNAVCVYYADRVEVGR